MAVVTPPPSVASRLPSVRKWTSHGRGEDDPRTALAIDRLEDGGYVDLPANDERASYARRMVVTSAVPYLCRAAENACKLGSSPTRMVGRLVAYSYRCRLVSPSFECPGRDLELAHCCPAASRRGQPDPARSCIQSEIGAIAESRLGSVAANACGPYLAHGDALRDRREPHPTPRMAAVSQGGRLQPISSPAESLRERHTGVQALGAHGGERSATHRRASTHGAARSVGAGVVRPLGTERRGTRRCRGTTPLPLPGRRGR